MPKQDICLSLKQLTDILDNVSLENFISPIPMSVLY